MSPRLEREVRHLELQQAHEAARKAARLAINEAVAYVPCENREKANEEFRVLFDRAIAAANALKALQREFCDHLVDCGDANSLKLLLTMLV